MSESQTLLERERELGRIERAVEAARGRSGSLLLIEGSAGIGKTALLEAAARNARGAGLSVLAARATEIEREFPFGAVRQLLEPALRAAAPDDREALLSGAAAPAATVLGVAATAQAPPDPGPGTLHALHWLLANLAEAEPRLLILDDAQWADAESLRFLAFLSPRLADLPVAVLVAARAEEPEALAALAATASDPASLPVTLSPLSEAATEAILSENLAETVAPEFGRACYAATGGNPFYLRALVEVLREDRILPTADSADAVLELGPQTVTRAIFTRIARLPDPASSVARALAVLGDGSELRHAAALAGVAVDEARAAIDNLVRASILEHGPGLCFTHPILANAVYADIGPAERAELHRRAATELEASGAAPEETAAHLLAVPPAGDDAVVAALRAAAANAMGRGAPASAMTHLRRALAEPPPAEERVAVLVELASAEAPVEGAVALEHLQEVLRGTEESEQRTPLVRALAQTSFALGRAETGIAVLREELGRDASEATASLETDLVAALAMGLDGSHVREADERLEAMAPSLTGESATERTALECLAFCRLRRGAPVADIVGPVRMRLDNAPASEQLSPIQLLMTVGTLTRCDELDTAETWARKGLLEARGSGSIYGLAAAHWLLGGIAHRRGLLADAVSHSEASLRGAFEYGAQAGIQSSLVGLVDARVDRGELDEASTALAAAGFDLEIPEDLAPTGELLESRARLKLAGGDPAGALRDFEAAAERFRERDARGPGLTAWRSGAAMAYLRLGEREPAQALAAEELELARAFGSPVAISIALQAAGLAAADGGLSSLEEAVEILGRSPARLVRAQALVERGAALRRAGERAAARPSLAEGLEIASSCHALPLAERAYVELRAAGGRPRKPLRTGVDALTPSEARVARLAASGMTNREIAQELFVTTKTVEFHLGQAYRKLDINSRADLSDALAGAGSAE